MNDSIQLDVIPKHKFLLLSIIATLIALYVHALVEVDDFAHLGISALYFLAVGKLIFNKRQELNFETSFISISVGIVSLAFILWQALNLGSLDKNLISINDYFLRMMPFLSGLVLIVIASKARFLLYWRELVILFFLATPRLLISSIYDPSPVTAKAAGLLLWYTGFEVQLRERVYVMLPNGGVKVFEGCSGIETMCYTLGLSVILLLLYPVSNRIVQWMTPFIAIFIGFMVNTTRVVLLALLQNWQQQDAFIYWHDGDGAMIFGMVSVMVLGIFYYFLPIEQDELDSESSS